MAMAAVITARRGFARVCLGPADAQHVVVEIGWAL